MRRLPPVSLMEYESSHRRMIKLTKQAVLLFLLFFLLIFLQTSFFPHFPFFGYIPNIILIVFIFLTLVEGKQSFLSFWGAFFAGIFLDIFSQTILGFWVVILLLIRFGIRLILENYVRIPFFAKR